MFFPIWDDQVHNWYTPYFSWLFLAINVAVFLFQAWLNPSWFNAFITTYGSIPAEIMAGQDIYTLLTNMFLHGSWMHLIGNMLYLYVFWDNIEASIGNTKFLVFYLAWWVAASAAHIFFNVWSSIPAVGASWAIAAVLWAYLVMFPWSKVKMLYIYWMRTMLVPAGYFLLIWIWMQLFSGVWAEMSNSGDWWGTARRAHIWWFAFGRIAGRYFKKLDNKWMLVSKEHPSSSSKFPFW